MAAAAPITTTDYHTGGEPFRIVTGGVPELEGTTVMERRRWAGAHLDHVRRTLVNEPRGHADMYGCFVTPPDDDGADLGVVFFHNEGYSTACGHGTIALVTWAIESGRVAVPAAAAGRPGRHGPPGPISSHEARIPREVAVTVDVPSGRLACTASLDDDGRVAAVRFRNVPSFVLARDLRVDTTRGPLTVDIGYGGAFYGSVDVRTIGRHVEPGALTDLIALQRELRPALEHAVDVAHPIEPELRGIYGVIFWEPIEATRVDDGDDDGDGRTRGRNPWGVGTDPAPARLGQRNVTVFADGEVDRSPCGSGTSARLAILHARGEIGIGERLHHRSIVDSAFDGWVTGETRVAGRDAVLTEVQGSAFRTGEHAFVLDDRDEVGSGFLLR